MATPTTTAVIYARVSSVKQADEGLPIESQIDQCQRKAAALEATVVRIFKDAGISGRSDIRPAFQEAIEYCAVFEVKYFITWDTSRFARNKLDAARYKQLLRRDGTSMVYASNDIDGDTDEGWLLESVFEMMDEQYSRKISRDTKRSLMKNARDGFFNGGAVPFGYGVVAEGRRKRMVEDPTESHLVREIFREYIGGVGVVTIMRALNHRGVKRRGKRWTKNTVNNLLKNWVYLGYITFNKRNRAERSVRPVTDWIRTKSHAALVNEEDFMTVQRMLGARAPTEGGGNSMSSFLFTGLLRCEACDKGLQIVTGTGRSKVYSYYNCAGAVSGSSSCKSRRIPASELDAFLVDYILDRILTPVRLAEIATQIYEIKGDWVKTREADRRALVGQLRSAEGRRAKLYAVLEKHGVEAPNLSDMGPRLRELNGEIKVLEASLDALESQPVPISKIDDVQLAQVAAFVREMVEGCQEPKKIREFLGSFIEKVTITGDEALIRYHPSKLVNSSGWDAVQSGGNWLPDLGMLRTVQLAARLPDRFVRRAA